MAEKLLDWFAQKRNINKKNARKALIEELTEVALEDGKITEDERKIIDSVADNVKTFSKVLEWALDDEVITKNEKKDLSSCLDFLKGEARAVSVEDKVITDAYTLDIIMSCDMLDRIYEDLERVSSRE